MTKGRLRRAAGSMLLGAACSAFLGPAVGFADETFDTAGARRVAGVWLASDSRVDGWRYVTRYDISVTGNRLVAIGALYILSPRGLTEQRPPTVSEFSGTIEGNVLTGELSIYRRISREAATTATRPLRGTVDFVRGEIAIQYNGPAPDGTSAAEAEKWRDADRTLTLRLLARKQPRQE